MSIGPAPIGPSLGGARLSSTAARNISEGAFKQVRELIVRGKLAPGSRVVESELAGRLGVSRTPVRSAIHRLQQEGYILVTSAGGNKARVAPLTQEDSKELYSIVGHLEGLAAGSAAQLDGLVRDRLIAGLRDLNEKLRGLAAAERGDPNVIFEFDINFHQAVVDAAAGPRLRALHAAVKPQTERYWRLYASSILDQLGLSVSEHDVIIQSIAAGDPEGAERAMQTNWLKGAERLSRVIATLGERGSW